MTDRFDEKARDALARGHMEAWPGYPDGSTWESIGEGNRAHWRVAVSKMDADSCAAALRSAVEEERRAIVSRLDKWSRQHHAFAAKGLDDARLHNFAGNEFDRASAAIAARATSAPIQSHGGSSTPQGPTL